MLNHGDNSERNEDIEKVMMSLPLSSVTLEQGKWQPFRNEELCVDHLLESQARNCAVDRISQMAHRHLHFSASPQ